MKRDKHGLPAGYAADANRGRVVYAGGLEPRMLSVLCASDDARAMIQWADQQTGGKCTLLMAYCALESLGFKQRGKGERPVLPVGSTVVPFGRDTGARN